VKFTDRVGEWIHRYLFTVTAEIIALIACAWFMTTTSAPWLVFLTWLNVAQFLLMIPLGWGDRSNDRKLAEILDILYNRVEKEK
jgi:hypothetical protein